MGYLDNLNYGVTTVYHAKVTKTPDDDNWTTTDFFGSEADVRKYCADNNLFIQRIYKGDITLNYKNDEKYYNKEYYDKYIKK